MSTSENWRVLSAVGLCYALDVQSMLSVSSFLASGVKNGTVGNSSRRLLLEFVRQNLNQVVGGGCRPERILGHGWVGRWEDGSGYVGEGIAEDVAAEGSETTFWRGEDGRAGSLGFNAA